MELGTGINNRYKKITFWKEAVDELLVNAFIESHQEAPAELVLDMDTTDMPLHGKQEGRFFHGCYDSYCYLPLYVFCGDHVLCARMREANHDAAFGCRGNARLSVESSGSQITHLTTPFSARQVPSWKASEIPAL
jgi:hypothetical protein